jgi:hypothetical protein
MKAINFTILGVEKVLFNRKVRKVGAKHAKIKHSLSILCLLNIMPSLQSGPFTKIAHRAIS